MRVIIDREGYEVGVHIGFPWLWHFSKPDAKVQRAVGDLRSPYILAKNQEPTGSKTIKILGILRRNQRRRILADRE